MRLPKSIDEFQHILNSEGWLKEKIRKKGTMMRKEETLKFYSMYQNLVQNELESCERKLMELREKSINQKIFDLQNQVLEEKAKRLQEELLKVKELINKL